MYNDLVSIIVPVYNAEKYLDRCVDSVKAQTYTNWELLLVDDGSKDASPLMCDKYASEDKRIRVFHQQNGGICAARNTGIKNIKGDYFFFCDNDDRIEPDAIEELLYLAKTENADMVIGGYTGYGIKGHPRWSVIPGGG